MRTGIGEFQPAGVVLAGLGFALTRFVVVDALSVDAALPFLAAGVIPLVAGLSLTGFGVVLAVGAFTTEYVRTVTVWAVFGTAAMLVVLAVTAIDVSFRSNMMAGGLRSSGLLVANVLVGGAIGGTITGDRAATNRSQRREIKRQADRGIVINRILRHEVLNAAAIVKGYADLLDEESDPEAVTAIREEAERIDRTINDVGELAERRDRGPTEVLDIVETVCEAYGDAIRVEQTVEGSVHALVDDRFERLVSELVDNAVAHGYDGTTPVVVRLGCDPTSVRLRIEDNGPGLPPEQQRVLTQGVLPEFDDPSAGFGLQVAALLVEQYRGDIAVNVDDGTTVTVTLPRVPDGDGNVTAGLPNRQLLPMVGVSVLAGLVMGAYLQITADLLPVIGSLYGVENETVGWITHLFHSVIFGLLFAAGRASPLLGSYVRAGLERLGVDRPPGYGTLLGVAWGLLLAVGAAGVIMPVWLRIVGTPAPIPNVDFPGVVSHVLWGAVLGAGYDLIGSE